jgi:hypothetical protein
MIRVDLNLEDPQDLNAAKAEWRFAPGLVPGEPNEGLSARLADSPARLAGYDDSSWDVCDDIQETRSSGFTFGWYRIAVTIPERVRGVEVRGARLQFETCVDDYGEIWIDGVCDRERGTVAGFNIPQRIPMSLDVQPGTRYVIACLAVNGPLAEPGGGIFMRYARLAFER